MKAGVLVFPCAIQVMADIKLVGVSQPEPMHGFSSNFQGISRASGAD